VEFLLQIFIFGFEGFVVDILAIKSNGRLLKVKIADLGYKNFQKPGHTDHFVKLSKYVFPPFRKKAN
jgi:hypothetical protein